MEFREITIQDRDWMRQLLGYSDNRAADFNFTVLYIWKDIVRSKVCRIGDYFVVRSFPKGASAPMYLFPSGRGTQEELREVLESCMEDAHQGGYRHCKTDAGEGGTVPHTHVPGHGQTDQEGLEQSLGHDKTGAGVAVEITHEAEEDAGQEGFRRQAS